MPSAKPLGPVKTYRLGQFAIVAGDNAIALGNLPNFNEPGGVGMLLAIEESVTATFATLASDPTVPSYMLDGMFDSKIVSSDGKEWKNHKGYHKPIREYDKAGWLRSFAQPADLPATSSGGPGSYPRTVVRRMEFLEPEFASIPGAKVQPMYIGLLPCRYFATSGQYVFSMNAGPKYYNGATLTVTACTLTLNAYVADWKDLINFPVAAYFRDRFKQGDKDQQPTCDEGAFARWHLAIDPAGANAGASATPADDLKTITRLSLAVAQGIPLYDRYSDEILRKYMAASRDEQKSFSATGLAYQEFYRFPDPVANTSGRQHYFPVLSLPRVGAKMANIFNFGNNKPRAMINQDNRAGVPAQFDHILTELAKRDDGMVTAILGSLGKADRFNGPQSKFAALPGDATRVPLVFNLL